MVSFLRALDECHGITVVHINRPVQSSKREQETSAGVAAAADAAVGPGGEKLRMSRARARKHADRGNQLTVIM